MPSDPRLNLTILHGNGQCLFAPYRNNGALPSGDRIVKVIPLQQDISLGQKRNNLESVF